MDWRGWFGLGAAGAGTLLYGALFETERLRGERVELCLKGWPKKLDGYRIGLIADLHLRDTVEEFALVRTAVDWLQGEDPDMVVVAGDFLSWWKEGWEDRLRHGLEGIGFFEGRCIGVPGNHDYHGGRGERLRPVLGELGIRLLQNERLKSGGVHWVGVDSANAGMSDPYGPLLEIEDADPIVVVWHEPDLVDWLPEGVDLMLSGHSHGGQFTTPWGWAPMTSRNGQRYLRGFYPSAPVPLYVSRGLATTGPAARLFCRPEVTVLTLRSASSEC